MTKSFAAGIRLDAQGPDHPPGAAPGELAVMPAAPCRPRHTQDSVVACIRERLAARAAQLGWSRSDDRLAGLHLVVDGRRVEPSVRGLSVRFPVPAGARALWLVSGATVPAALDGGADHRALGVCLGRLVIDDGFAAQVTIADDPRLCVGFHDVEHGSEAGSHDGLHDGPQRWTGGRARLPSELWAHCGDGFFLRLELTRPALPRWVEPPPRPTIAAEGPGPAALVD